MILARDSINNKLKCGLYVVSTPIGNLGDITFRAIEILKKSSLKVCEDTRVSNKLLLKHNIVSNKLISNHKFNRKKNVLKIIQILKKKKLYQLFQMLVFPNGVSDPGKIIVNECTIANER